MKHSSILILDWKTIDTLIDNLVISIRTSGKQYSSIVGILRGGVIPAVMLSHRMGIPMCVSNAVDPINDPRALIVDEIYDTGTTVKKLTATNPNNDIIVLVSKDQNASVKHMACCFDNDSRWVQFPWEITND